MHEDLERHVYRRRAVGSNSIKVQIFRLRSLIAPLDLAIINHKGQGYSLVNAGQIETRVTALRTPEISNGMKIGGQR